MKRGFSLPELLLTLAIIGIVTTIGLPRTRALLDGVAVQVGARQVRAAHIRARMTAVALGQVTLLHLAADTLRIRTITGPDTSTVWTAPGPGADRVALSGPARPLVYAPLGVTMGISNGTWHLTRGAAARDVIVSRLGRMRIR